MLVVPDGVLDVAQDAVAFQHSVLGKLAQGHPLDVHVDRDNAGLHQPFVEEELHKLLHLLSELRLGHRCIFDLNLGLGCLGHAPCCHSIFRLLISLGLSHLDLCVSLVLLRAGLFVVFLDCFCEIHATTILDSTDTDAAVASVNRSTSRLTYRALLLEHLTDVELVMVLL